MTRPPSTSKSRTIRIAAPVEKVWRALTDHQQFGEWFKVKLETPFVVGARGHGYMTYPGYEHMKLECEVVAMDAPRRFAFTWHPFAVEEGVDYSSEPQTLQVFTRSAAMLSASDNGSRSWSRRFSSASAARRADRGPSPGSLASSEISRSISGPAEAATLDSAHSRAGGKP